MNGQTACGQPKDWDELEPDEKIELLKSRLLNLRGENQQLRATVEQCTRVVLSHQHTEAGGIVAPPDVYPRVIYVDPSREL